MSNDKLNREAKEARIAKENRESTKADRSKAERDADKRDVAKHAGVDYSDPSRPNDDWDWSMILGDVD